jgi:hypothetical protein
MLAPLAAAAALAGCPLPQPLPDYPPGTITPPRIVVDDGIERISRPETIVRVPAACDTPPSFTLAAKLIDVDTFEVVRARWFVNYAPDVDDPPRYEPEREDEVLGSNENPPLPSRAVPPWTFYPYSVTYPTIEGTGSGSGRNVGALHVVELVVSNGFFEPPDLAPLPYRSPSIGPVNFETQVYRWVFLTVPETPGQCDPATDASCAKCP